VQITSPANSARPGVRRCESVVGMLRGASRHVGGSDCRRTAVRTAVSSIEGSQGSKCRPFGDCVVASLLTIETQWRQDWQAIRGPGLRRPRLSVGALLLMAPRHRGCQDAEPQNARAQARGNHRAQVLWSTIGLPPLNLLRKRRNSWLGALVSDARECLLTRCASFDIRNNHVRPIRRVRGRLRYVMNHVRVGRVWREIA
jgi:hypothetical protein